MTSVNASQSGVLGTAPAASMHLPIAAYVAILAATTGHNLYRNRLRVFVECFLFCFKTCNRGLISSKEFFSRDYLHTHCNLTRLT